MYLKNKQIENVVFTRLVNPRDEHLLFGREIGSAFELCYSISDRLPSRLAGGAGSGKLFFGSPNDLRDVVCLQNMLGCQNRRLERGIFPR